MNEPHGSAESPPPLTPSPELGSPDGSSDWVGQTVGDFQILRKLGSGGMGEVFLARQLSLKRQVALKLLRDDLAANRTALQRFQAEAEAVARVTHANIVQVYAVGEQNGLRYMALEFVDGRNLRDYLARKGPPSVPTALSIISQIAAALQRASESGLVHRDIKPDNILLTRQGDVKVADFGLSRLLHNEDASGEVHLTQSGMTLGTPLYMSPEQVHGLTADHRSDIYSLGVTSYHLLAGEPPFQGNTTFEVAAQHVQSEPPPLSRLRPDLPFDLCQMVHRMMAKRPEARYQSAGEIVRDIARFQAGLPISEPPASQPASVATSSAGPVEQSPFLLRVFGLAVVFALTGVGWLAYGLTHRPTDPTNTDALPGLPTARPPEPVRSARERQFHAVRESRSSQPADLIEAGVGLGLIYLDERRWPEAEAIFDELEEEKPDRMGNRANARLAMLAGRLGKATLLARQGQAEASLEQFERALYGPPRLPNLAVIKFLVDHPDMARAVGLALERNRDATDEPLPPRLDWLCTPDGLLRGPGR